MAQQLAAADQPPGTPEWVTLREHLEALRDADERLRESERQADARLAAERDQRYAEVKAAEEKALKVKETADAVALGLQRETQTYKDEKANELREQISSERGRYATKDDLTAAVREINATIKPLADYVSTTAGRSGGVADSRTETRLNMNQVMTVISVVVAIVAAILLYMAKR
jgi:vacuolar-type H+-ATPase subunit H